MASKVRTQFGQILQEVIEAATLQGLVVSERIHEGYSRTLEDNQTRRRLAVTFTTPPTPDQISILQRTAKDACARRSHILRCAEMHPTAADVFRRPQSRDAQGNLQLSQFRMLVWSPGAIDRHARNKAERIFRAEPITDENYYNPD